MAAVKLHKCTRFPHEIVQRRLRLRPTTTHEYPHDDDDEGLKIRTNKLHLYSSSCLIRRSWRWRDGSEIGGSISDRPTSSQHARQNLPTMHITGNCRAEDGTTNGDDSTTTRSRTATATVIAGSSRRRYSRNARKAPSGGTAQLLRKMKLEIAIRE